MNCIEFTVATNFDRTLIEEYNELNRLHKRTKIVEVFGSLPLTLVGHGRSSIGLPNITYEDLEQHIRHVHHCDMKFNYLMNGVTGPEKSDADWPKKCLYEISRLKEIGVDSITVTDTDVLFLLCCNFPSIKPNISLIKGIDTVEEAKRFSDLVHSITLNPHSINRNISRIAEIVNSVECSIGLYANISCINNCPHKKAHYEYVSRYSRQKKEDNNDPFIISCACKFREDRTQLLRSPFIRPEDIENYSQLGVDIFKLSDRKMPTETLVRIVSAYMDLSYNGNLFDLIFLEGRPWRNETQEDIVKFPYIDNSRLNEIDFFRKITTLKGNDLEEFYQYATKAAVDGSGFWR